MPIETQRQILDSGLPWSWPIQGDAVETEYATSDDPIKKAIWNGKIDKTYILNNIEDVRTL